MGLSFWVPTHAPQLLVTHLRSVSTFLSYHARGSPLGVAPSWVVSVPGSPNGGVGISRVRLPPTGTRTYGLEATFLLYSLLFLGDAFARRCPTLAMAQAVNLLTLFPFFAALERTHHVLTLTFGQRLRTVHKPLSLELITCFQRKD